MESNNSIIVPELLAPAGSLAHLKAAIHAGADAVYMGGQRFGARAYARNFSEEEMIQALRYAHFYHKKLYLTVNTLIKESEMDSLYDFLLPYYKAGLDGVIVQDLGAASFIREHFPAMEIHASTQMTITDVNGALAAKRFGMTRVVPARELSLEEIGRIKRETGLEVEVFAHGALCYCYSGQCLLSSTYGDRSGNRGRCAQPCRLAYDLLDGQGKTTASQKHVLSPKDLCAYSLLEDLCEIGVDSLKIEGRMKNIEYVAGVTKIYRQELDRIKEGKKSDPRESARAIGQLEELYCREGFTDGYFKRHNGREMMAVNYPKNLGRRIGTVSGIRKFLVDIRLEEELLGQDILVIPTDSQNEIVFTVPAEGSKGRNISLKLPKGAKPKKGMAVYRRRSERLLQEISKNIIEVRVKLPVTGEAVLKKGEKANLTLFCEGESVTVTGETVMEAKKKSIEESDILRQLNKTGNVPFSLQSFDITLDDGAFYPMSGLKELRQQAYGMLQNKLEKRADRKVPGENHERSEFLSQGKNADEKNDMPVEKIAAVYSQDQLKSALATGFFTGFLLPFEFFGKEKLEMAVSLIKSRDLKVYFGMPRVYREEKKTKELIRNLKQAVTEILFDGIYVYTIGEAELLEKTLKVKSPLILAASVYQWNCEAIDLYREMYQNHVSELPIEQSVSEWGELVVANTEESFEMLIYGRYPVMITAGCVKETCLHCNRKPETFYLKDQKKRRLPVSTCCSACYNIIWKDTPYDLLESPLPDSLSRVKRHRFDLCLLPEDEIKNMIGKYKIREESRI